MNSSNIEWTESKEKDLEGTWSTFECILTQNLWLSVNQSCQSTRNQKVSWWWYISIRDESGNELYSVSSSAFERYDSVERCKEEVLYYCKDCLTTNIISKIQNAQKEAQEFTEILKVIIGDK